MTFEKLMNIFGGWNFPIRISNDNLDALDSGVAYRVMATHLEWYDVEVVSCYIVEGILCVRLKI